MQKLTEDFYKADTIRNTNIIKTPLEKIFLLRILQIDNLSFKVQQLRE